MRRFKIYIHDSEPRYGGNFYMETIEAANAAEAQRIAEDKYGYGAFIREVQDESKQVH